MASLRMTGRFLSFALCIVFVVSLIGCGGGFKRRISFHKKHPRNSRGRYVVSGQSHRRPPKSHQDMFIWPLDKFTFMSGFGIRRGRRHDGVDLAAKGGTPVKAAANGEVAFSGRMRGYGNLILLKHDNNYFTAYAHNRANLVKKGKKVKQGQTIAKVGRTGRATGNHVHFEIRRGQQAMDPVAFLPARADVKVRIAAKSKKRKKRKSSVKRSKGAKIRQGVARLQKKKTPAKTTIAKKTKISSKDSQAKSSQAKSTAVKKPAIKNTSKKKSSKKLALKKTKSGKAMSNK